MTKEQIYKIVATAVTALLTCLAIAFGLSSCNVTRTVTTKSEYWQKGDTSMVIQTKTIESYDASKKL
jgi:ABC-type proline/glycine betaine transport system substrate-binding protein